MIATLINSPEAQQLKINNCLNTAMFQLGLSHLCKSRCWPGLQSSLGLTWGEIHFQAPSLGCWQATSFACCWLEDISPLQCGPLYKTLPIQLLAEKTGGGRASKTVPEFFGNLGSKVVSHHLCVFCSLEGSYQAQPIRGGNFTRTYIPGSNSHWAPILEAACLLRFGLQSEILLGFPGGSVVKNPLSVQESQETQVGKISWRRAW